MTCAPLPVSTTTKQLLCLYGVPLMKQKPGFDSKDGTMQISRLEIFRWKILTELIVAQRALE